MKVHYCDLCACPLKEGDYFQLFIAKANPIRITNEQDYFAYLQSVEKQVK
jgi:hypothetical protein